jgi:hypothetical protein
MWDHPEEHWICSFCAFFQGVMGTMEKGLIYSRGHAEEKKARKKPVLLHPGPSAETIFTPARARCWSDSTSTAQSVEAAQLLKGQVEKF